KNLTLRMGQCNTKRYMPHLLEHIRQGRIDAKRIISHRLPLEEAPRAYEIFAGKLEECMKVVFYAGTPPAREGGRGPGEPHDLDAAGRLARRLPRRSFLAGILRVRRAGRSCRISRGLREMNVVVHSGLRRARTGLLRLVRSVLL